MMDEIKRNLRLMDRQVSLSVKILQENVRHGRVILDIYLDALKELVQ